MFVVCLYAVVCSCYVQSLKELPQFVQGPYGRFHTIIIRKYIEDLLDSRVYKFLIKKKSPDQHFHRNNDIFNVRTTKSHQIHRQPWTNNGGGAGPRPSGTRTTQYGSPNQTREALWSHSADQTEVRGGGGLGWYNCRVGSFQSVNYTKHPVRS